MDLDLISLLYMKLRVLILNSNIAFIGIKCWKPYGGHNSSIRIEPCINFFPDIALFHIHISICIKPIQISQSLSINRMMMVDGLILHLICRCWEFSYLECGWLTIICLFICQLGTWS